MQDEQKSSFTPPPPPPGPVKTNPKTKFTFEFEIYHNGSVKRKINVSALNDDEGAALEMAIADVGKQLKEGETYRYTNGFKKESVST